MDRTKSKHLCLTAALAGGAGFFMKLFLYRIGMDEKGMLVRRHPLSIGIGVVFLALLLVTLAVVLKTKKKKCAAPVGRIPALGSLSLTAGLLAMALQGFRGGMPVFLPVLALLGALGMGVAAACQWKGKQPSFLANGALCLFLAFYLVNRYQVWSKEPQLMDYVLILGGTVLMMLYAYQMAAGNVTECSLRSWMLLGTLGAFLCLAGSAGEAPGLCLGGGIWMLAGLWAGAAEGTDRP